jgi:cytoskeletal protein CcmA (bactofilin family)
MGLGKGKTDNEIVSLLGKGTEVIGDITFSSGMRVDGFIKGKVHSEASLIIGSSGKIDAEVFIRHISINGEFRGIIRASDRVEIHKDGKVYGDIYSPCLIIEAGATFEGRCNMSEAEISEKGRNSSIKSENSDFDKTSGSGPADTI